MSAAIRGDSTQTPLMDFALPFVPCKDVLVIEEVKMKGGW